MDSTITLETARDALNFIPAEERGTWIRIGKALFDEYGEDAFDAWDHWSQAASNYDAKDVKVVWRSICKMNTGKTPVTVGTLIYEAKRGGWKIPKEGRINYSEEEGQRLRAEREARREAARLEQERVHAIAAQQAEAIWAEAAPADDGHPYLQCKGVKSYGLRVAKEWAKEYIDDETGEVTRRVVKGPVLLVPIMSGPRSVSSLQAILPSKQNFLRRDKDYLTDGRKAGCYFVLGKITPATQKVIICEGYSTGASLHEIFEVPVIVAFDSTNLEEVASSLRGKLPDTEIVIAADNDQFTKKADGSTWNPGVEYAEKAAKACNGSVLVPRFKDLSGEPTDFNDLHQREGAAAVIACTQPDPTEGIEPPGEDEDDHEPPGHFSVLGYDHERYYIFVAEKRQVMRMTKSDFTDSGFIELAPLQWWETEFASEKGINRKMALNYIIRLAHERGIYDPSRIRGRGAWFDDGRAIFHHGKFLTIDSRRADITAIKSKYVYELERTLPDIGDTPLSDEDGRRVLELAGIFKWAKPGSGALLAGWTFLAPICGALRWRPHVWITGGAGTGKSTVLSHFLDPLMHGHRVSAQGNSTEAGIRQTLKSDALPVLFDESESNTDREASRIQGVLAMVRQASTESQAQTLKGTVGGSAMSFHVRSMFALASIQVGLQHQADIERMTVLALRPKGGDADPAAEWRAMSEKLYWLQKDELVGARMIFRALSMLNTIQQNIQVFGEAAAKKFGTQRQGDQYGTLLAGTWSLVSSVPATLEDAERMIDAYDWSEHTENGDSDESKLALAALMECHIRLNGGVTLTVYELVRLASDRAFSVSGVDQLSMQQSDDLLQRYGMRVHEGKLLLSNNSQELKRMMAGTPYSADMRGLLLRLEGADRNFNSSVRFNGVASKCIRIPLSPILNDETQKINEALPFGLDQDDPF